MNFSASKRGRFWNFLCGLRLCFLSSAQFGDIFDVKTIFLSGKDHDRELYFRPPKEGLPGVEEGSLIKIIKGVRGLKEAPRLWYLKAKETLFKCG